MKELNQAIAKDASLGDGYCVGHSYFCGLETCTDQWINEIIKYDLIPMLKEYWFDDKSKADQWIHRLQGVLND